MARIELAPKLAGETVIRVFDFISYLGVGETISSAAVTATTYSGVDASPSAIVSGSVSTSGTKVSQLITGGVLGVTYGLVCAAVTSLGQTVELAAFLQVIPDL